MWMSWSVTLWRRDVEDKTKKAMECCFLPEVRGLFIVFLCNNQRLRLYVVLPTGVPCPLSGAG